MNYISFISSHFSLIRHPLPTAADKVSTWDQEKLHLSSTAKNPFVCWRDEHVPGQYCVELLQVSTAADLLLM